MKIEKKKNGTALKRDNKSILPPPPRPGKMIGVPYMDFLGILTEPNYWESTQ